MLTVSQKVITASQKVITASQKVITASLRVITVSQNRNKGFLKTHHLLRFILLVVKVSQNLHGPLEYSQC
ncbi:hypothetical protein [Runella limosa]|uniref:hypothetical protein n=1 Tax=Runella limosa TaxID=370978 RepID=UPI0003F9594E|nr:hypothetical protein [Runella limosa]